MKAAIGWLIGLVFVVSLSAEPLLEGRVRLESGEPVADAQVRIFDLTDLRQGAIARALTDGTGYFALPLTALAGRALPARFALGPNYPNPFNPSTIIPYQLAASSAVRLEVFNLLGQRITTLVDGERPAGFYTATWHATDGAGRAVGAGVYIYRMTVGVESQTGRMVLLDGQAGVSAGGAASVMPGASGVGGSDGADAQVYGLVVSGSGLVPYVDSSFRVESGMAPVELVVSAGQHSAGKVTDDDCAFCDLFGTFNDQQGEEEEDETPEEEAETDSTSSEGGPDLVVQAPSVSAVMLTPGQEFTLNATVHNQGDEQAAATTLHYYRSNNATITSSDTEVGTDAVGALDASATSAASIALTAPTSVSAEEGIYYGACVDSVRGESNTDNNCSSAVKITVSGQVATEEEEDKAEEEADETLTISSDMVTLPPPTWVFAGDVPADDQTVLREEMEYSRAYFSDRFGVEATGFTVLVGSDYETLSPVYREVIGRDLSDSYPTFGVTTDAWVTVSRTGGAVVTLIYGRSQEALATLEHYIVHEYFHVLQGQLASGFAKLQGGEVAFYNDTIDHGPRWLMEGLASYADYAYTPGRPGRRPFLNDRYYPYLDISGYQREWGAISLKELSSGEEDYRHLGCSFGDFYVYPMGFAASVYLLEQAEEDSYVNYWTLLGKRPTWQQAFEEAFGIGANDFYKAFDEWLPSQLPPPRVTLDLQVRWPGTGNQLRPGSFLYAITEEAHPWKIPPRSASTEWFGQGTLPTMIFEYEEGAVGTAYLSLWWYHINDLCTEYLLGWYKDGELTDRREHATAVEFTGRSSTLDWSLPGDPDTLPRLEERKVGWCE